MKKITKLEVVAGLAAAAAGAYYLYYSKSAKKNRAAMKSWMGKAEKEIVTEAKKLKDAALNEDNYRRIVSAVSSKYQKLRKLESGEVEEFISTLGSAWTRIKKDITGNAKALLRKR